MTITYTVRRGDGLARIAWDHGFAPATILDHPDNAAINALRANSEILAEGDVVAIPPLEGKVESAATDCCHVFRMYGVPVVFKVRLLQDGEPRSDLAFALVLDGARTVTGRTDGQGWLRCMLMPNAAVGELYLDDETEASHRILFGHLDPIATPRGIASRLRALGYFEGLEAAPSSEALSAAITQFQLIQGLPATGMLDGATTDALADEFGS